MSLCSQCHRSSGMYNIGGHVLCLNCYEKYMMIEKIKYNMLVEEENRIADAMEMVTGVHGVIPRTKPLDIKPIIDSRKVTYNNIKVDNSVIGVINTGEIGKLDVSIEYFKNEGNEEFANAIKELTEAIANEQKINEKEKNQILEQLNFLVGEAKLEKGKRKYAVIKSVLNGIKNAISLIPSILLFWNNAQPFFMKIFDL